MCGAIHCFGAYVLAGNVMTCRGCGSTRERGSGNTNLQIFLPDDTTRVIPYSMMSDGCKRLHDWCPAASKMRAALYNFEVATILGRSMEKPKRLKDNQRGYFDALMHQSRRRVTNRQYSIEQAIKWVQEHKSPYEIEDHVAGI
jgi:hypothetical protein